MKHKLFLASLMLLFCTILSAETYNGTCGAQGNNLTWTLDTETGTLTISGTGEMKKYNYYGYALWYSSCSSIKTIIIENGVSSIGNYAFNKCSSLTSITIPNSVTTIGERAFSDCSSLTSITIPNSVTSIGFRAFDNCSSLTSVTIPNSVTSIGQNAFDGCSGLNAVHISDLAAWCKISFGLDDANPLHYAHNLYLNGKLVTDLTIPNSITSIGNRAFDGCRSLTSVTIPNSVTSIGNFAFDGCSSLTSVTIPNSVTSIGNYAFFGCSSLTSITIPNSVTSIGSYAFAGCSSLTSVTIPNSVTSIGSYAFAGCSSLTSVTIPNSVTSIGSYAFYNVLNITYNGTATDSPWGAKCVNGFVDGCFVYSDATKTNLLGCSNAKGDITIPNSVTSIGSGAFSGCSGLTSVTIPNSVTSIGSGAFNNVQNIAYSGIATGSPWGAKSVNGFVDGYFVYSDASKTNLLGCSTAVEGEVTIPNSVTSIGSYAFAGCRSLTSVTIPNSVTSIGNYAFSFCSGLTSVTIGNSVTSIGFSAFDGCYNLNEVHISDLAVWCKISSANLGNPLLYAHNLYLNGELVTDLVIPNNVTSIGNYAFDGCSSLTSITIPNSVTSIGNYAFSGCSGLTSVTIPNSITSIGENAFEECKKLTAVYITDLTAWCKISFSINNSFPSYSCNPLYYAHNLYLNGKLVTNLVIPNSVTSIGAYAFYGCSSLTSVTIPNSVTSIGEGAFYNVLNIVYSGSATGSPWGAKNVNGFVDGYFVYSDATKTNLQRCSSSIKGDLVIPNGVTSIGNSAFSGCSSLTSIQIPNSVTSIGDEAFNYCRSLTSITIPNSVTSIGDEAFNYCSSLTSITIPNSVTSIGDKTFYYCHSLTSVTIPNSVTSIGDKTFYYCGSLSSVTIPNSVKRIGSSAFEGCRDLQHIYIYTETPPSISSSTFEYIHSDAVVYVPVGSLSTYQAAAYWKDMNIKEMVFYDTICETKPTSVTITLRQYIWEMNNHRIVSCGMEGGEEFEGSTLEYIGLEPESEYEDIPIVMTSNIGETSTVNISFTTSALTLTTLASKAVSANTAILLAETNMSDAETSCGFEWRRNDQPEDMPSNQVLCPVANGLLAGRLKGLRDDTYYKYRAFYKSAAGNMFYGDWQYIFTGDVAVEFDPVLYTYAAQFVSERKATLKGYALPGADDFTEQGFEYWAESRRTNAPARRAPQYAIGEKHTVTGTGISMRVTLEDLDEGTVYKYRTYAKVGGKTLYGSEMTFTTEGEWIEYTLTANSDDAAAGSVTGSGTYHTGTEVSIEAVPATGYRFVRWQDDNTDNPRTIVLTEDMTFTAYFERIPDALEETDTDRTPSAKKVYENGQLYILLPDGTRYNLQGMEVK